MSRENATRPRLERRLDARESDHAPGKSTRAPMLQRKNNGGGVTRTLMRQSHGEGAAAAQAPAQTPAQTPAQQGPAILDDSQFLTFFSHVPQGSGNLDLGQFRYAFSPPQAPRPAHELFTPDEQRAVNAFMSDLALPPVGTFRAFFDGGASDAQKFLFSAVLHVLDRSRVVAGRQRAVRADDCGDWVARVVAYRFNQPFHRRGERARLRRENHQRHLPGVPSPEGMYSYSSDQGNATRDDPASPTGRSHQAVTQDQLAALQPGDWIMLHWHPHTSPGADNHSVMFLGWDPPGPQPRWHDGYVGIRVANQIDNNAGGGFINHLSLCANADQPRYVYHVSRVRGLSGAELAHGPEQQQQQQAQAANDQQGDHEQETSNEP